MPVEPRGHQLTVRILQRIRDAMEAQATAEQRTVADVVNIVLADRYPEQPRRHTRRMP
jgi:hypothetical protein